MDASLFYDCIYISSAPQDVKILIIQEGVFLLY
jgi:hypothetical protein